MELINELKEEVMEALKKQLQDQQKFKALMKDLIVQGLIRLMEPKVNLRCRTEDLKVVKSIIRDAEDEYCEFIKKELNETHECTVEICEDVPLTSSETKLGGVMLYCGNNRIVITNTIDSRFQLCLAESIPDFRNILFPSLDHKAQKEAAL